MDPTIQVNIREYISINFTIKFLLQIILLKKYVRVQNRVPWATQKMTNDCRNFALPITVKKSDSKGFCSA